MTTKRLFPLIAMLFLAACSTSSVAIAVSSLGIAGAGLEGYCGAGGTGCTPAVTTYADLVTTLASQDATIIESGQATQAQIAQVVAGLGVAIANGKSLAGLNPQQQAEVSAIIAAASEVLSLIDGVQAPPVAAAANTFTVTVQGGVHFPFTAHDRAALVKMRAKIAAVKK